MTALVVVPCLAVERPQIREAWRALVGQGRDKAGLSDDVVRDLLWRARALPVALDVLANVDLYGVRFEGAVVDVVAAARPGAPLLMIGWRRDDELVVEVLVVSVDDAAFADPFGAFSGGHVVDDVVVRVVFPFRLLMNGDDEITAEDLRVPSPDRDEPVRLRRFSVGKN